MDVYSLAATMTARNQAAARMAWGAYEKRKTRAAQVAATREQAASDGEVCAPQKNEKTSAFLEVKALGGDGVEVPVALVARATAIRAMVKLAENFIKAPEHEYQQLRASAMRCKVCLGPTRWESAVAAPGFAKLLASMGAVGPRWLAGKEIWWWEWRWGGEC
jgi:hypothetical protein